MKSTSSHSAKQPSAKRKSSSTTSMTDWAKLKSSKAAKATAEHPEADVKYIVKGIVRRGLTAVPAKSSVSLRLDNDVLEWFRAQGAGYQTKMNAVLKAFRDASA
jgi:uncharacterized protein (DUF4415 family)